MQLLLKNIRVNRVIIDMSMGTAQWFVSGHFITDSDKIIGEFTYSSEGLMSSIFLPNEEVQSLTAKLLTAIHLAIENQMVAQNEQESISIAR